MLIPEYNSAQTLYPDNVLLIDGPGGTRKITAKEFALQLAELNPKKDRYEILDDLNISVAERRMTYRGKNLGDHVSEEQYDEIDKGTFRGMFTGDYWVINGFTWRIADFDYWYDQTIDLRSIYGSDKISSNDPNRFIVNNVHHITIIPDEILELKPFHSELNFPKNGVLGCKLISDISSGIHPKILNSFGESHIMRHIDTIENEYNSENGLSHVCFIILRDMVMTEYEVVGCKINGIGKASGLHNMNKLISGKCQFSLFTMNPKCIDGNGGFYNDNYNRFFSAYWLRDIATSNTVCSYAWESAIQANTLVDSTIGYRPYFNLCKQTLVF